MLFTRLLYKQRVRLEPKDKRAKHEAIVVVLARETDVSWISDVGLVYPKNMWRLIWNRPFKPH